MANAVTGIRMVCAAALIFCRPFSVWFYVFFIAGGISDVLDGFIARRLGKQTKGGARFDTVADIVFTVIVVIKVVRAIDIPVWLIVWIAGIAVIKAVNVISGFVRYKRFVAEHTVMNKICGVLLFAVPLCIGLFPCRPALLIIPVCVTATCAAVQEGYYIHTGKEIG